MKLHSKVHFVEGMHARIQSGVRGLGGGGQGVKVEMGSTENKIDRELLNNTGSLENSQSYEASIQSWAFIGTPVKRRFAGGRMIACL